MLGTEEVPPPLWLWEGGGGHRVKVPVLENWEACLQISALLGPISDSILVYKKAEDDYCGKFLIEYAPIGCKLGFKSVDK